MTGGESFFWHWVRMLSSVPVHTCTTYHMFVLLVVLFYPLPFLCMRWWWSSSSFMQAWCRQATARFRFASSRCDGFLGKLRHSVPVGRFLCLYKLRIFRTRQGDDSKSHKFSFILSYFIVFCNLPGIIHAFFY